ncbi:MAG: hypothetical protein ACLQE9_07460 [Roseiarcus sp.]
MHKSMMQIGYATLALIFGLAAAAPPALAGCVCHPWRHTHRVAAHWTHVGWGHARWAYHGWGPGVGFYALTGVAVDQPAVYNHPYYYGGGPYGNCSGYRVLYDAQGNLLGRQTVYVC